jgi:simple sugar transport system substrate-binding protein
VIGFIYVGPRDDYGYNQAHAEAAAILKKMAGLKVVEEEKVPETVAVEKSMESMINLDGATLLFPTSFGYFDPHMLKMAAKFPNIQFRHCGGLWTQGKHPMNTGSYFGYIDEAQYLSRHRGGRDQQEWQAGLRRGQADPPGPAQHQRLHARRAVRSTRRSPPRRSSPATGRCRSRKPKRPTP